MAARCDLTQTAFLLMPLRSVDRLSPFWQATGLAIVIVLIVVAPAWVLLQANQSAVEASDWVQHTLEVDARAQALGQNIRDVEAASLALAAGVPRSERFDKRIADARAGVTEELLALQRLTQDNPDQQLRLGELRGQVRLRLQSMHDIAQPHVQPLPAEQTSRAVTQYPVGALIAELIKQERDLLAQRQVQYEQRVRLTELTRWGAVLAQILVLAAISFFALRQMRRRLNAERDAQTASAHASVVLDTVREPIAVVDRELRVVLANVAFGELYGMRDEPGARQKLTELSGGAWADEETTRRLAEVLNRGRELWDYEREQITHDGVRRVMMINARRMPLPETEENTVMITASDISARRAGENRIHELNRQLEGKVEQISDVNRELEAFSYSVSHDLRAPLRHTAGFADKLQRHLGEAADEKSRHYLQVISNSAKRMSDLIDDLLVYSRLGRSAMRLQAVDMQSLVQETRSMLDANARMDQPGREIQWKLAALPIVVGDENMLRQVWLNLLGNAVKYSVHSQPSIIEVEHRYDEERNHHFSVRDNGAGFDMAFAGKLFGVFQRLHSASEFSGTGIGLASVRRVLTRHNGRIWAESRPGEGATFHFILPSNAELARGPSGHD